MCLQLLPTFSFHGDGGHTQCGAAFLLHSALSPSLSVFFSVDLSEHAGNKTFVYFSVVKNRFENESLCSSHTHTPHEYVEHFFCHERTVIMNIKTEG